MVSDGEHSSPTLELTLGEQRARELIALQCPALGTLSLGRREAMCRKDKRNDPIR
jgi:hypothetical protein